MREHLIFFISIFIILLLSSIMLIHHAYYYRKILRDASALNALKRYKKRYKH
jgi:hypothetical protein